MGNWFCRPKKMKIVILGLDYVGKTTLLYHMKLDQVIYPISTIGYNVETIDMEGVELTCWDLGSRDKFRPLWRHFTENSQGFIFVIDSCDKERLSEAVEALERYVVMSDMHFLREDENADSVIMVLANKQDVEGAMPVQDIEDVLQKKFSSKYAPYTMFLRPCSAHNGDQVKEVFACFARQLCLRHTRKSGRGYISLKEQEAENENKNTNSELTFKVMFRDPVGYLKSFF